MGRKAKLGAKEAPKAERKAKVQLFYANADKLARAKVAAGGDPKRVKEEYLKMGGLLREGWGFEEV